MFTAFYNTLFYCNFAPHKSIAMEKIKIGDKIFKPFISAQEIDSAVKKVADKMNEDVTAMNPVFIGNLKGESLLAAALFIYFMMA